MFVREKLQILENAYSVNQVMNIVKPSKNNLITNIHFPWYISKTSSQKNRRVYQKTLF